MKIYLFAVNGYVVRFEFRLSKRNAIEAEFMRKETVLFAIVHDNYSRYWCLLNYKVE